MSEISLYEINVAYRNLQALLLDDTASDIDLTNAIATVEDTQVQKIVNISKVINEMTAYAAVLKRHKVKINERQKKFEDGIDRLKQYIKESMIEFEQDKIENEFVTVSRQLNPPKVEVVNADLVPENYILTKEIKSIDKAKIQADYKATGMNVMGTNVIQEERIVIK